MITSKVRRGIDGLEKITIYEVDEDYNPVCNMTQADMKVYLIGIGWDRTYISDRSTRTTYSTYSDNMHDFKVRINGAARRSGDEIIEWKLVYTHEEKYHVKKIMNAIEWTDV